MRFFIDTGLEDEMTTEAVAIDFKMRSVSLADPENEEPFWMCVKASAPSPDGHAHQDRTEPDRR